MREVSEKQEQLKTAEEMGNHTGAATLRRKISLAEEARIHQQRHHDRLTVLEKSEGVSAFDNWAVLSFHCQVS